MLLGHWLKSLSQVCQFSSQATRKGRRSDRARRKQSCSPAIEVLEDKTLLATFIVTNPADAGAGTLREAVEMANSDDVDEVDDVEFTINVVGPRVESNDFEWQVDSDCHKDGAIQVMEIIWKKRDL